MLTSSLSTENSTGTWGFTDCLIDGFNGTTRVDLDEDGFVTLAELARHVEHHMAVMEKQLSSFIVTNDFDADLQIAPGAPRPHPRVGELVAARDPDGVWWDGQIVEVKGPKHRVRFAGYDSNEDLWVEADALRPWKPKVFAPGTRVQAQDDEEWYDATVLATRRGCTSSTTTTTATKKTNGSTWTAFANRANSSPMSAQPTTLSRSRRRVGQVEVRAGVWLRTMSTIPTPALQWHNVLTWGLEGQAWRDTEHPFDRLSARAHGVVRDVVWNLSRNSAGLSVRFETDSPRIAARWTLRSDPGIKMHMPPVAVAGLDLYAQDPHGTWRWLSIGKPETIPSIEATLIEGLAPGKRAYTIYLPLFANVESLEIGVSEDATFAGVAPRTARPIAFYGTSIVHGAAASRPGMTHSAILGRRLNHPVLNLGFSGNGQMEPEVGRFLAETGPRHLRHRLPPQHDRRDA